MSLSERRLGNKYYPSQPGRLLPLAIRRRQQEQRSHELSERAAEADFKTGKADVRSFPRVREYLTEVVDGYEERFAQFDPAFEAWHQVRVQMLDSFGDADYFKKSRELKEQFENDFFKDPQGVFLTEKYEKARPVISKITHVVSLGK